MYGYIYKFTFLPTGKFYVGKHHYENHDKLDENYWGSGVGWNRDINNYIKSLNSNELANLDYNKIIKREILEWCNNDDDLNLKEQYWIEKLNAQDLSIAYNLTPGGNGGTGSGCKWYNDDKNEFYINTLLNEYIDPSWTKGRLNERFSGVGLNTIWINNGVVQKHCSREEAKHYIAKGWKRGMLYRGDEWRRKCGHEISSTQRELLRQTALKTIKENKNPGWIKNQFKKGQTPFNKNKVWITNGVKNHYVNITDAIPDGWYRGCTQRRNSKEC